MTRKASRYPTQTLLRTLETIQCRRFLLFAAVGSCGYRALFLLFLLLQFGTNGDLKSFLSVNCKYKSKKAYRCGINDILPLFAKISLETLALSSHLPFFSLFLYMLLCFLIDIAGVFGVFFGLVDLSRHAEPFNTGQAGIWDLHGRLPVEGRSGHFRRGRKDTHHFRIQGDEIRLNLEEQELWGATQEANKMTYFVQEALNLPFASPFLVLERICFSTIEVGLSASGNDDT